MVGCVQYFGKGGEVDVEGNVVVVVEGREGFSFEYYGNEGDVVVVYGLEGNVVVIVVKVVILDEVFDGIDGLLR